MLEMRITGAARIRAVSAQLRDAAQGGLEREMRAGIRHALDPFKDAVRTSAGATMPSGYGPVLAGALRFNVSNIGGSGVRVVTYAKGKSEDRDLVALDAGRLRHPVYGRTRLVRSGRTWAPRPNPWVVQGIRPRFFSRPADQLADEAAQRIIDAVDRVADQIERG